MEWTKLEDQMPTEKDLPFTTYGQKLKHWPNANSFYEHHETWDDSDWFLELDDKDRNEWIWWKRCDFPKER